MKYVQYFLMTLLLMLTGCAGMNPNPGERSSDVAWVQGNYQRALKTIKPNAVAGYPWAQLRLGIMYELGQGLDKDTAKALEWYQKAAKHVDDSNWGKGLLVGAAGPAGYFNQNSDALIAQYRMAAIYLEQNKLIQARDLIQAVLDASNGEDVFLCCEFDNGRWITAEEVSSLHERVERQILDSKHSVAALN